MRRLALAALMLAACGDSAPRETILIDAGLLDGGCNDRLSSCGPIAQTGCPTLERCTFFHDTVTTACTAACVPDAPTALDQPCTVDGTSQLDDCASGGYCVDGVCRAFCEIPDIGTCGLGFRCADLGGVFIVGACVPDA